MLRAPPEKEATLSAVRLEVEMFEVPVTFMAAPVTDEVFRVATLAVEILEVPAMFIFGPKIDEEFRVAVFNVERFEFPVTLRVVEKRLEAFITMAFPLVDTFMVEIFARV